MMPRRAEGFALTEVAATVVVACTLLVLLAIMSAEDRRQGRLGEDLSKLRQIGAWTAAYGADNADQFWSFSWRKGQSLSQYPDLNNAATDVQAGANQAVDILRRVAGREDIPPIAGWLAHSYFGHLTLADYATSQTPSLTFVSAGDAHRLRWARDPAGFDQGIYQPAPPQGPGNAHSRWPYGSTFELATTFYDASEPPNRISQGVQHFGHQIPASAVLVPRLSAAVAIPSQKAHLISAFAWHFGTPLHCTIREARAPFLFIDGSVRVQTSADANRGWVPNAPWAGVASVYSYEPRPWEPPIPGGGTGYSIDAGRFRWTRGFLAGRDFGGPEACTGQSGCP